MVRRIPKAVTIAVAPSTPTMAFRIGCMLSQVSFPVFEEPSFELLSESRLPFASDDPLDDSPLVPDCAETLLEGWFAVAAWAEGTVVTVKAVATAKAIALRRIFTVGLLSSVGAIKLNG